MEIPKSRIPVVMLAALQGTADTSPSLHADVVSRLEKVQDRIVEVCQQAVRDAYEAGDDEGILVAFALYAGFPFFTEQDVCQSVPSESVRGQGRVREAALETGAHDIAKLPYADYLQTSHWKYVRDRALERSGGRCQICGIAASLQVHHNSYEHVGDEREAEVVVLCDACHRHVHQRLKGSTG